MTEKITGAQALVRSLEMCGVEVVFGLPGGAILPVYDPILDSPIRHVLVRHEQGAGHMASGYAHVTGQPGVCIVTSGPAATNLVTPLADAMLDSVPMVAITGQVASTAIGTDAFQECDTTGITMSATKHNWLVTSADEIPRGRGRGVPRRHDRSPGPGAHRPAQGHLQRGDGVVLARPRSSCPACAPPQAADDEKVAEAIELIRTAERPVIYAGGGILKARAAEELLRLAEMTDIPVVTTLMARGAFPDSHRLCLGMPGMHGNYTAVTAIQQSDLLLALGSRFDDRVTGKVDAFAPHAKVVHVDIDAAEHGKVRRPDVSLHGDCKAVIAQLNADPRGRRDRRRRPQRLDVDGVGMAGDAPAAVRRRGRGRGAQAAAGDRGAA